MNLERLFDEKVKNLKVCLSLLARFWKRPHLGTLKALGDAAFTVKWNFS